jgi:16S rRNA (guanine966-N2)-methyltransferase
MRLRRLEIKVRIVGGRNRGRAVFAPKGLATRPTSDRTRESLFSILNSRLDGGFGGRIVVDLFAGTGALGLEALSRGAAHAIFVDNNQEAIKIINENVRSLGEKENASLHKCDATLLGPLPSHLAAIDIVFVDPPYEKNLVGLALNSLVKNNWLAKDALCIVEMAAKENFKCPVGFEYLDQRKYGKAAIYILQPAS